MDAPPWVIGILSTAIGVLFGALMVEMRARIARQEQQIDAGLDRERTILQTIDRSTSATNTSLLLQQQALNEAVAMIRSLPRDIAEVLREREGDGSRPRGSRGV